MFIRSLLPLTFLALVACETTPPPPVQMAQEGFETIFARAQANPSPASVDLALTELLARGDLSADQRTSAQFLRAEKRWQGKFDLPGAVQDYDAYLLAKPDSPDASTASRHKVFAATEVENAERRLAWLQNHREWFNDKVLMGDLDEAAARYRKSGLQPTERQLYTLREAGYVCAGQQELVFRYGSVPSYGVGAAWCNRTDVS